MVTVCFELVVSEPLLVVVVSDPLLVVGIVVVEVDVWPAIVGVVAAEVVVTSCDFVVVAKVVVVIALDDVDEVVVVIVVVGTVVSSPNVTVAFRIRFIMRKQHCKRNNPEWNIVIFLNAFEVNLKIAN